MPADHVLIGVLFPLNGNEDLSAERIAREIIENDRALFVADKMDKDELRDKGAATALGQHVGVAFHRAVEAGR